MARPADPLIHRNQQPEYVQAFEEIAQLQAALVPVRGRITELGMLLCMHEPEEERISGHAEAALHFAATGTVRRSPNADTYGEEHLLLRQQAEALTKLIDQKQQALYQIESSLATSALAARMKEHDAIRARYVQKLVELDAVRIEETEFLASLQAMGYHQNPPNCVEWFVLGRLDDPQSLIASRVRELRVR